jgi:hypothetical protein
MAVALGILSLGRQNFAESARPPRYRNEPRNRVRSREAASHRQL